MQANPTWKPPASGTSPLIQGFYGAQMGVRQTPAQRNLKASQYVTTDENERLAESR